MSIHHKAYVVVAAGVVVVIIIFIFHSPDGFDLYWFCYIIILGGDCILIYIAMPTHVPHDLFKNKSSSDFAR